MPEAWAWEGCGLSCSGEEAAHRFLGLEPGQAFAAQSTGTPQQQDGRKAWGLQRHGHPRSDLSTGTLQPGHSGPGTRPWGRRGTTSGICVFSSGDVEPRAPSGGVCASRVPFTSHKRAAACQQSVSARPGTHGGGRAVRVGCTAPRCVTLHGALPCGEVGTPVQVSVPNPEHSLLHTGRGENSAARKPSLRPAREMTCSPSPGG